MELGSFPLLLTFPECFFQSYQPKIQVDSWFICWKDNSSCTIGLSLIFFQLRELKFQLDLAPVGRGQMSGVPWHKTDLFNLCKGYSVVWEVLVAPGLMYGWSQRLDYYFKTWLPFLHFTDKQNSPRRSAKLPLFLVTKLFLTFYFPPSFAFRGKKRLKVIFFQPLFWFWLVLLEPDQNQSILKYRAVKYKSRLNIFVCKVPNCTNQ